MEILNLLEEYLSLSGLKESTKIRYGYMIRKFITETAIIDSEKISLDNARDFLNNLKNVKNLSIGTVNDYRSAIKYLFEAILDKGWNDRKIAYLKGYRSLPSVLEKSQIIALIDSIDDLLYKTILTTIYSSGLRIQEALNLKISDIDSKRMQIHIRESKNGSARNAILSEKNLVLLRHYLKVHPLSKLKKWEAEDYIFSISSREKPICSKSLRSVFNQAVIKLKIIKKVTVHTLRHSFATHLLEEGVSIFVIKELLGHRSISSTVVYLHVVDTRKLGGKSPFDTPIGGIDI